VTDNGHFGRLSSGKPGYAHDAGIDRRSQRTRRALHEALIGLILERDYDGITVADIADAANVGRSTFYMHFVDKDDLLRSGADHLRAILVAEHNSEAMPEDPPERRALGFSRFLTGHLKEQLTLYRALMRGRGGTILMEQVKRYVTDIVRSELKSPDRAASELTVQFIVGAYLAVLSWWLERGGREPAEEIDRQFRELAQGALMARE